MKARLAFVVPASTSTGASSAPTTPMPATTCDSQRTATIVATRPITPPTASPTAGDTRW